ncbi:MAG: dehydrogenase [Magnetovibrio sp.]|nr:dehydrogenase [Magnetovibrio sp.]
MSFNTIRVALIGCGRIAGHHCAALTATTDVSLAAVCDLDIEKAEAYGTQFNVPHFTNYHSMLTKEANIDVVAIITPSGMHGEHAMDILDDYNKHVIVEKPTFMRPDQLYKAYDLAEKYGMHIFPVFQNRYNKAVKRVRHALDLDELGSIRLVNVRLRWCRPQRYYDLAAWRGTFSHDGGCLTNQGIHHIDLIRHLCGEVNRVNAIMKTMGVDIEAEDAVTATLEFDSGAIGSLEVTTAARPDDFEASISIVGSTGLAQIGGIAVNELQIFTPSPAECSTNSEDFKGIEGHGAVYGYGHAKMYCDIVTDLNGGASYPVSRSDCLATLKLLDSFYRSDEAGTWIGVADDAQSVRLGRENKAISNLYKTAKP